VTVVSSSVRWYAFVAALVVVPLDARALWYDLGHRIVARIAEQRLTPEAQAAVRHLLGGQSLADASVWADNIRQYRHDADALHYVNIPLSATAYDAARDCPHGRCVIAAIASDTKILADSAASPAARAEALRFLVHFVGDLHQPLHVADNGDRGGNRQAVYFLGDSMNLHRVWDGELIKSLGLSEASYLDQLSREMDTLDLDGLARGTIVDWAMEGHRIAVEHAYRLPANGRLGSAYVRENRPLIDHALIAAGVRLARLINESLGNRTGGQ
jgi:nuclease S1